ncbi:MAG: hypothetical protein U0936_21360 [Planctomycetaceae bacterium]
MPRIRQTGRPEQQTVYNWECRATTEYRCGRRWASGHRKGVAKGFAPPHSETAHWDADNCSPLSFRDSPETLAAMGIVSVDCQSGLSLPKQTLAAGEAFKQVAEYRNWPYQPGCTEVATSREILFGNENPMKSPTAPTARILDESSNDDAHTSCHESFTD